MVRNLRFRQLGIWIKEGVFLLLFVFFISGCPTVFPKKLAVPKSFGTIKGRVIDKDSKAPLEGADVLLTGPNFYQWRTDQEGRFEGSVEVGTYELSIYKQGYYTFAETVLIEANKTKDLGAISLEDIGPPPPPFK